MTTSTSQRARFGIHFSLISRQWRRVMQTHLASIGLTDTAWVPLVHLNELSGITLKALALRVGVDSSSLVRVIDSLERDGLVERKRDATDGRAKQIFLTPEGEVRVALIRSELIRFEQEMLVGISDEEIQVMAYAFQRLQQNLDAYENGDDPQ